MGITIRTQANYQQLLLQLLPPSDRLDRAPGSTFSMLAEGMGGEFSRVDAAAALIRDEADPRTTYYLLTDWERVCGLSGSGTLAQRRSAVLAKLNELGGQSEPYLVGVAAALGYTITISRFALNTVDSDVDAPLYDELWVFAFQVNAPLNTVIESNVNDDVDAPIASWGNADLETAINEDAPAHTLPIFAYA
jgi:uncharacterized protein YmfQ (DUF2313 family)